jgi:glycosyltransferase involved in cell wall biosynthesis
MSKIKTVLVFADYYVPGYKAGGPIRSIQNLIQQVDQKYSFKIITGDRDIGDQETYPGVTPNQWNQVDTVEVFYASPNYLSFLTLRDLMNSIDYDLLYLNSFFTYTFSIRIILLLKLGFICNKPVILAPRGVFSKGALNIKKLKKSCFILISKFFNLHSKVIWHATSDDEKEDIYHVIGLNSNVIVAPNLPTCFNSKSELLFHDKKEGTLKIAFLSRISKKKNLEGALNIIRNLEGNIFFNIFGPIEDKFYWDKCKRIIECFPPNILVEYQGLIAHELVPKVLSENDIFLFPTLGENFGHVIIEALLAGCPVVISDKTPWHNLSEKKVGWDIPLEDVDAFQKVLQGLVWWNEKQYRIWSDSAKNFAESFSNNSKLISSTVEMFSIAMLDNVSD